MATRKEYLKQKHKYRSVAKRKHGQKKWLIPVIILLVLLLIAGAAFFIWKGLQKRPSPEDTAKKYVSLLKKQKYEDMYRLLDSSSRKSISEKDFISRNQNIYEGIEANDILVTFNPRKKQSRNDTETLTYHTDMSTCAGKLSFDNQMTLTKGSDSHYKIVWDSTLIFPELKDDYKVRIDSQPAQRGSIYDRNGNPLATSGLVSEVGLVPGKMSGEKEADIQKIAEILGMSPEEINNELSASYVQDDTFVPLKQIPKDDNATSDQLLTVPGILINDATARIYPLGAAAGPLTGYVQSVTAEELKQHKGEGYHTGSLIGKSGLELAYESELKAVDGSSINIVDAEGNIQKTLAAKEPQNGKDITVTIDSTLQQTAYEQFSTDPGAAAAMNPKTGEVLALVSTPAYDPNEFILGMSASRWEELNSSPDRPLSSRFQDSWVPGSTFKAITGAIGVESGKLNPEENLGYVGLSWQKDASWGDYHVTTLQGYGDLVNLENAFVYSDNIYFARAALNIGTDTLIDSFKKMGFEEQMPFELPLQKSTYDDDGKIDSEIQLADTGYGQGQLLVNPVHMLSIYSLFVNQGNMLQPVLTYSDSPSPSIWKNQVVSPQTADTIKNDLVQVIENPSGTGAAAKIDGLPLLGKTGTAEIKESQEDTTGVERGWFICETAEDTAKPIAFVGMVEDVKGKGGSHYVVDKVRASVASYEGN